MRENVVFHVRKCNVRDFATYYYQSKRDKF